MKWSLSSYWIGSTIKRQLHGNHYRNRKKWLNVYVVSAISIDIGFFFFLIRHPPHIRKGPDKIKTANQPVMTSQCNLFTGNSDFKSWLWFNLNSQLMRTLQESSSDCISRVYQSPQLAHSNHSWDRANNLGLTPRQLVMTLNFNSLDKQLKKPPVVFLILQLC